MSYKQEFSKWKNLKDEMVEKYAVGVEGDTTDTGLFHKEVPVERTYAEGVVFTIAGVLLAIALLATALAFTLAMVLVFSFALQLAASSLVCYIAGHVLRYLRLISESLEDIRARPMWSSERKLLDVS